MVKQGSDINLDIDPERVAELTLSEKKSLAQDLYFQYAKAPQIANTLNLSLSTLKSWIYGTTSKSSKGWQVEREMSKNQLLKDLSSNKRGMVYGMVEGSLFLLYDFIEKKKLETIKSGKSINIRDAEKITTILGNLHKIVEQDNANSPDDPDFEKPTDAKELLKRLRSADPFIRTINKKGLKDENDSSDSNDDDVVLVD